MDAIPPKKRRSLTKMSIEFEESSGNVFADLGLEDANELQTRSEIGYHVFAILKERNLKQREIAILLGIKQVEVSHLMNGHFSRFSTDKLLEFLKRLNQKVTIQISPHKKGEPYQEVAYGV
jgi:predicted XRE-type DNA-binding protein